MTDYRERIQNRASVLDVALKNEQLAMLNQQVNDRVKSGLHESDALDYAYFCIKNKNMSKNNNK